MKPARLAPSRASGAYSFFRMAGSVRHHSRMVGLLYIIEALWGIRARPKEVQKMSFWWVARWLRMGVRENLKISFTASGERVEGAEELLSRVERMVECGAVRRMYSRLLGREGELGTCASHS